MEQRRLLGFWGFTGQRCTGSPRGEIDLTGGLLCRPSEGRRRGSPTGKEACALGEYRTLPSRA